MVENDVYTLKEISLLDVLLTHDRTGKMRSLKIVDFYNLLSSKPNSKQSTATVRRNIAKLMERGFIAEGMKNGKRKSYYLTKTGADFITELNEEVKGGNIND